MAEVEESQTGSMGRGFRPRNRATRRRRALVLELGAGKPNFGFMLKYNPRCAEFIVVVAGSDDQPSYCFPTQTAAHHVIERHPHGVGAKHIRLPRDRKTLFRQSRQSVALSGRPDDPLAKSYDRSLKDEIESSPFPIPVGHRDHNDEFRDLDVATEPRQSHAPPACTVPVSVPAGIGRAR
jgi:hypothetical protein